MDIGFWIKLAIGAAIVLALGGMWARYEYVVHEWHTYEQKYTDEKKAHKLDVDFHEAQVKQWESQVEQLKTALSSMTTEKKAAVTHNFEMFKEKNKKVQANKKETDDEIKAVSKPTDVVTMPDWVASVYDNAVEGSRVASEGSGNAKESRTHRLPTLGKTDTFDATAIAQVLKGNIDQYNALALQCSKLIDTELELEAVDAKFNTDGVDGKTSATGGDIPAGTATN